MHQNAWLKFSHEIHRITVKNADQQIGNHRAEHGEIYPGDIVIRNSRLMSV